MFILGEDMHDEMESLIDTIRKSYFSQYSQNKQFMDRLKIALDEKTGNSNLSDVCQSIIKALSQK